MPPKTQINILRYLARNGKKRRTEIADYFGKNRQEINDAIIELDKKGVVTTWCDNCKITLENYEDWNDHKHKFHKKRNNINTTDSKPLISITYDGFIVAIDDPIDKYEKYKHVIKDTKNNPVDDEELEWKRLSSSEFWNYLINELGDATQEEIMKLDVLYQLKILHVDFNYLIPIMFDRWTKDVNYDEWYHFEKILYLIRGLHPDIAFTIAESENGMTKMELLKKINNVKIRHNPEPENIEHYIDFAILNGYLQHIDGKLELTHSGLLEYLFLFYRKYFITHENLKKNSKYTDLSKNEKTLLKLEEIRKKYSFLLPDIFNGNNFNDLGISLYEVVKLLLRIYKNLGKEELESNYDDREDFQVEEYRSIERYLQTRKETYYRKLTDHVQVDASKNSNIEELNNAEKWYFKLLLLIDNYDILRDGDVLPEFKNIILDPKYNYYKNFSGNITNMITFEFYSYYKMYVGGWENSKMVGSKIQKTHDQQISVLIDFTRKYLDEIESQIKPKTTHIINS